MNRQTVAIIAVCIALTLALPINQASCASTVSATIQSGGTIITDTQNSTSLTVILRNICITDLNPNSINITEWANSYVANHNYSTAITLSDMHQYGIWWYGYSFSNTSGTWMRWNFTQLKELIDAFHSQGWKVGLESTAIAWQNQEEYKYITTLHPELSFTNAKGQLAAITKNGTNQIIPNPFATFATDDPINNITAGTRLIDLYTLRLTNMINDGLEWDFWFGTDGWNGLNLQGYTWTSSDSEYCYSFSNNEIEEWVKTSSFNSSSMAIGLKTVNTGLYNGLSAHTKIESSFQCYGNGTVTWLMAYLGANTATNVQLAIYNGTESTADILLSSTKNTSVLTDNWYNFTLTTPINVTAGNYYHFSLCADSNLRVYNQYTGNTTGNDQIFGSFNSSFGIAEKQAYFNGKSINIYTDYDVIEPWSEWTTKQKAAYILNNQLASWSQYWQDRFAQGYAQIKQAFINAGQSANTFHTIGSADLSSLSTTGNLSPFGMYNYSLFAKYNSFDYIYVDQEAASDVTLGENQLTVGKYIKSINTELKPIIGLQLVNWLGYASNLTEVKDEYFIQANDTITFANNIIMMQYPNGEGWAGWTSSDINSLISYIKQTISSSAS